MKRTLFSLVFSFLGFACLAQNITPKALGFQQYTFEEEMLGEVNFYLSEDSSKVKKPLLVYLDGSGAFPLFQKVQNGIASTVVIDFQTLRKEYRILLIGKPDVPFVDVLDRDENGFPIDKQVQGYTEKLSLDWRVNSADMIIDKLVNEEMIDSNRIVVLGFSEGAQVAPKLASINKKVTHIMLFGGNGLNQLFDPIVAARMKATRGQISEVEAQKEIDSIFIVYGKIYKDRHNTEQEWWGHTYKRWASFTEVDPYKYLLELEIPIYIANGSLDENSILSADYIQLEFIKNGKENLTYKTYPNYDHQFNEILIENGILTGVNSKIDSVMHTAFEWLDSN